MKLKTILGMLGLASTTVAAHPYGGVFAGIGLGGIMLKNQTKYIDALSGEGKTNFSKAGFAYQLHGGYLHEIGTSRTMIGFDLYFNSGSAKRQGNVGVSGLAAAGTLEQKRGMGFGLGIITGKLINPQVMLYGRIGIESVKYKMKLTLTGQPSIDSNVSYGGIVPGAGVSYKVAPNLLVGAEYHYAGLFKNKEMFKQGNLALQVKPVEHRAMIKLSYLFHSSL